MTHDFTPPGGSTSSSTPSNRADARAGSASVSSRSGVGSGTGVGVRGGAPQNMFQAGRRLALAAWIAIAAGVALLVGIGWSAALALSDETLSYAQLGDTGPMNAANVVPGMCLTETGADGNVNDVDVVACNEPHRAEIFTQMNFDLAKYPGRDEVNSQALDYCGDRIADLLPEGASWVTWTPSQQSWSRGDRVALCIAVFDEPLSEPLSPNGIKGIGGDEASVSSLGA